MIINTPTLPEKLLSVLIVALACLVQAAAKYETDQALMNFSNEKASQLYGMVDSVFTFLASFSFWIIIIVLIHLLLRGMNKEGSFFAFLIFSGYGFLAIGLSNSVSYLLNSRIIAEIESFRGMGLSDSHMLQMLNNSLIFRLTFIQSRFAEILLLIWCIILVKKIYRVKVCIALMAALLPVAVIVIFSQLVARVL